jgi:hypothetical protein
MRLPAHTEKSAGLERGRVVLHGDPVRGGYDALGGLKHDRQRPSRIEATMRRYP